MFFGPTPVREALAHAELLDVSSSRSLEAIVLRMRGGLLGLRGEFDTGRRLMRRSGEIEAELGRIARMESLEGHFLGPMETDAANYGEAERLLVSAFERMFARGDTGFSSTVAASLGQLYVRLARWDDAERYAQMAVDIAQPDDVDAQSRGIAALARVQAAGGDYEQAESTARRAVDIAEATDYLVDRGLVLFDLAEVLLAAGKRAEGGDAFRRAVENFDAKGATVQADRTRRRLAEVEG